MPLIVPSRLAALPPASSCRFKRPAVGAEGEDDRAERNQGREVQEPDAQDGFADQETDRGDEESEGGDQRVERRIRQVDVPDVLLRLGRDGRAAMRLLRGFLIRRLGLTDLETGDLDLDLLL